MIRVEGASDHERASFFGTLAVSFRQMALLTGHTAGVP